MSFFIIYYVMKQYILPLIVENIKFKLFFLSLRTSLTTHQPTKVTKVGGGLSYFYNYYNPTY
jgi:hypothetical protein